MRLVYTEDTKEYNQLCDTPRSQLTQVPYVESKISINRLASCLSLDGMVLHQNVAKQKVEGDKWSQSVSGTGSLIRSLLLNHCGTRNLFIQVCIFVEETEE